MPAPPKDETLSSGEFTRRSRLSAKALRIYDQIGLLRPAEVGPANRYRRYRVGQLQTARLIAMLRGIDMSLAEIGWLLADLDRDHELAGQRLNLHLTELEALHTSRRTLVRHIHAILREEANPMFTIQTRHVPARRVMSIQRRLRALETEAFMREAKQVFAEHLGSALPAGPFSLIFHGIVDHDSDGPLEATLACSDQVGPTDLIGIRTEPAHDEALTTITKAEWAYPAILAAYDAVACSPVVAARPGSRLSCREVYLAEPEAITDDDLICDIAFPLGERPEPAEEPGGF
ncbi:MAG: MerR family transcriptional regulator [Candidatus Dormiibacterota bacterium]